MIELLKSTPVMTVASDGDRRGSWKNATVSHLKHFTFALART
jgi:hypothetical protein